MRTHHDQVVGATLARFEDLARGLAGDDRMPDIMALMLWPASEIARSRLREANPIPGRLTIERAGERVRISFDGRLRETALHARPIIVIGLAGDELRYRLEVDRGALVQRFDGEAGGRLNTIRLEGDLLIVHVVIFSGSLPMNVSYDLRYLRIR
jgi:hypothetical protein